MFVFKYFFRFKDFGIFMDCGRRGLKFWVELWIWWRIRVVEYEMGVWVKDSGL